MPDTARTTPAQPPVKPDGAPSHEPRELSGPQPRRVPPWFLSAGVVGVIVALPVAGMWVAPGPPMEEGFMLVFPERLLAGDIPNRDFLHLYGPGSLWLLAGLFQVLGVDLWVERMVGLLQLAALVGGVAYVGYRWGRATAVAGGVTAAIVIMPPIGLTALAWVGGVALALWAVILAVDALDGTGVRDGHAGNAAVAKARRWRLLLGGLLAGFALLFRPDLVLALVLPFGAIWLWGPLDRSDRRYLLGGTLAGVSPYVLHLALAGPANAVRGMVIEPVFDLRPGRSLPFPPPLDDYASYLNRAFALGDPSESWPLPALADTRQVFVWVPLLLVVCAVILAIGVLAYRAGSRQGWRLLALGLLVAGTLPQMIQRPDAAHLAWVSAVPFGLLPAALVELLRERRLGSWPRISSAAAAVVPLVLLVVLIPNYTWRWYGDYVAQTFGHGRDGHAVTNRDRTFYYGREAVADAANALLADVEATTSPGQRLIVGPGDLRKTNYSEVYLYFLLPQLEPGTHYIEMDPGVANAEDSGLADELREADVVILSTVYDGWDEPNTSRDLGSAEPDRVLAEDYCLYDSYGSNDAQDGRGYYELYVRCEALHDLTN